MAKFRALSKQGLEQAYRTYGFLPPLNLAGAPIHPLIDCVDFNEFRFSTEERMLFVRGS